MKKWFAVAMSAALLAGCQKTAEVRCVGVVDGISCSVTNTSSSSAEVCWRVAYSCASGATPWARSCQRAEAGATASRTILTRDVWGADKCDRVVGMTVDQVTVK